MLISPPSSLERQRQAGNWGSLASQLSLIREFRPMRDPVSEKTKWITPKHLDNAQVAPYVYMHTHARTLGGI